MAAPLQNVCTAWATTADLCSPCDDYDMDTGLLEDQLTAASNLLYTLSGYRWPGSCQDIVRPCSQYSDTTWRPIRSVPGLGSVANIAGGCGCQRFSACSCGGVSAIELGAYPVTAIDAVKIDGATINSSLYDVINHRYLVWMDPDASIGVNTADIRSWPCCQDLTADPDTDDDTFEVTFTYGTPPPQEGVGAAAELACHLAMACQPETAGQCRLPPGVQTLARQGATVQITPDDDLSGLPQVRWFLKAHGDRTQPGKVLIPGRNRGVVRLTG